MSNINNRTIIKQLKKLDLSSYPQESVSNLVNQLSPKIVRMTFYTSFFIERIRSGDGFTKRSEMTYKEGSPNDKYNRATIPGQSVFYGTISHPDEPDLNRRYIALSECSKLLKSSPPRDGKEVFTISKWHIKKSIQLAVIVNEHIFKNRENKILKEAKDFYIKNSTFIDNPLELTEYCDFCAEEFSKPVNHDYQYIISATIAERLMNATNLDGIIYPSVRTDGIGGMNVAIKKESVDEALFLDKVAVVEYIQTKETVRGTLKIKHHAIARHSDGTGMLDWNFE